MTSPLHQLSLPTLIALSKALESDRLEFACGFGAISHHVPGHLIGSITEELKRLTQQGFTEKQIAYLLTVMAEERSQTQHQQDQVDLVWTGEPILGKQGRDTRVVVQNLFRMARQNLSIASYAVDTGDKARELFAPLVEQMEAIPTLKVKMFLNIAQDYHNPRPEAKVLSEFAEKFRHHIWHGRRLPEVYYDRRVLSQERSSRACLHAKCVIADDEHLLITSANFTEAAHLRNIEAGVLLRDPSAAQSMRLQFDSMIERGHLVRLPHL